MPISLLFLAAVAVALLCPQTAVGRGLKRILIDRPAAMLTRLTYARVALLVVLFAGVAAAFAVARHEGLIVIAQTVPEGLAWFAAFDVAAYIDLVAIVWLVAATVRLRAASQALREAAAQARQWALRRIGPLVGGVLARGRSRRSRPTTTRPPRRGDDDRPAPAFGLAFA